MKSLSRNWFLFLNIWFHNHSNLIFFFFCFVFFNPSKHFIYRKKNVTMIFKYLPSLLVIQNLAYQKLCLVACNFSFTVYFCYFVCFHLKTFIFLRSSFSFFASDNMLPSLFFFSFLILQYISSSLFSSLTASITLCLFSFQWFNFLFFFFPKLHSFCMFL